eukprot:31102-Pelagococcus_subviridis.AAC.9
MTSSAPASHARWSAVRARSSWTALRVSRSTAGARRSRLAYFFTRCSEPFRAPRRSFWYVFASPESSPSSRPEEEGEPPRPILRSRALF